jgi:aminoglycoside phosphotransferase (APT) family kinase protein
MLRFAAMSQDPRLEPALRALWPGRAAIAIPIEEGITNRNYVVELDDADEDDGYVLRLSGANTELLGIDRNDEVEAGRAAAAAGVGPEVVAFLPELGCLVTRLLGGSPIPQERLGDPYVMPSVVASIKAIHACPPIRATFPVFRIVERFRDSAEERGVAIPKAYGDAHQAAARIEAALTVAPAPLTTCHNDLLNANLLLEGDHTWIIDYEYAGMGDPFFDLGNLSVNNGLDDAAQALLLGEYFGTVLDVHRARLALMRIASDFREAMWGVLQQAISTLDFDYAGYADRHFARLLGNADDARMAEWLDAAKEPLPARA